MHHATPVNTSNSIHRPRINRVPPPQAKRLGTGIQLPTYPLDYLNWTMAFWLII